MEFYQDFSLYQYNSFHIDVKASRFYKFETIKELKHWLSHNDLPGECLVLGGGSNLLFTQNYDGCVFFPAFRGIEVIAEDKDFVLVRFAAGEIWDTCVEWSVKAGLSGIENLSGIPGHAGAAPVQNIGAYGVEVADVIEYVEGVFLNDGAAFKKTRNECCFGYRNSIFKSELKNKTVITSVVLRLSKINSYSLNYGILKDAVEKMGEINLTNIRCSILDIRHQKLPDPEQNGNAGSFFKNPLIDIVDYQQLLNKFPDIPGYRSSDNKSVKIPAGWLIEQTGWKGKSLGRAGVHNKQALVIVNKGGASGKDIVKLSQSIQDNVFQMFGIDLKPEVNII